LSRNLLLLSALLSLPAQSYDFSEVTRLTQAAVTNVPLNGAGVVLMKDGVAVYEQYFGSYRGV